MTCFQKFSALGNDLCFFVLKELIQLKMHNSIVGGFSCKCVLFHGFILKTFFPEEIALIFDEVSILRKMLQTIRQKFFCLGKILHLFKAFHNKPALELYKARRIRIFFQKVIYDRFCFFLLVKFIQTGSFPECTDIFHRLFHFRSNMIHFSAYFIHAICFGNTLCIDQGQHGSLKSTVLCTDQCRMIKWPYPVIILTADKFCTELDLIIVVKNLIQHVKALLCQQSFQ